MRHQRVRHLLLWALGRRVRYRVSGESMSPGLRSGDEVLVNPRAYRRRPPRAGDVVVARHPWRSDVRLIKRVASVTSSGALVLRGDNPDALASTDSRTLGALPLSALEGRVVYQFGRRGPAA
jgi:nickel-type superoxide dismutase maturation protease